MMTTKINGLEYAFEIHQQNPSLPFLLMLHGFMGDHHAFRHLIEPLSAFCNPVTVDLVGHGQTAKPEDSSRYQEQRQVADILALIDNLGLSTCYLYGYSMGGRLALKIALNSPHLFNGLILESINCGIENEADRIKRKKKDIERAEAIKKNFSAFLNKWEKLELFDSPLPEDDELKRDYYKMQASQLAPALAASLLGFGTGVMKPTCNQLDNLNLPVLLIAGSADKKYQKLNKTMAKKLDNGTFQSLKAGHRVHLDNPRELITHIQKFIKAN